jgi:hypothetical protein
MKIQKIDSGVERNILTAMIVSPYVLSRVAARWDGKLFRNGWSNLIGTWCVGFLDRYGKAPEGSVHSIFERWCKKDRDETTIKLIGDFLKRLSNDYESERTELNEEYLIDAAGEYFTRVKLERLAEGIQGELDIGRPQEAEILLADWVAVRLGGNEWTDVFQDAEMMKATMMEEENEPLVKYPGALGEFWGDSVCRDSFIAFMGPEKRGKSWWLLDMAFRAALQRRRVAVFEAGDMSRKQILRRFYSRIARWPRKPRTVKYPVSISREEGSFIADVVHEEKEFSTALNYEQIKKAAEKIQKSRIKSQNSFLRISAHPSNLSVKGIKDICLQWAREDWVPDVIVIDYADLLESDNPKYDRRDQINDVWKRLRGVSQEYHCLVVTATQSDSSSYKASIIDRSNFSEDKRKLSHVTGTVGICQTVEEKEIGAMRLNWVVLREDDFVESKCVSVATCLPLANPAVISCW